MKREQLDERKKKYYVTAGVSHKGGADNRIEIVYGNKTSTTIAGPFKTEEEAKAAKKKIIADFKKTGKLPSIPSRKAVINIEKRPKWVKARDFKGDSGTGLKSINSRTQNENNLSTLSMTKKRLLNEIAERVAEKLLSESSDLELDKYDWEDEEVSRQHEIMLDELDAWYAGDSTMSAEELAELIADTIGLPAHKSKIETMLKDYEDGFIDQEDLHASISSILKAKIDTARTADPEWYGDDY